MARNDPTIYMRIPQTLKDALDAAALENKRSLTAEVVARLEASFSAPVEMPYGTHLFHIFELRTAIRNQEARAIDLQSEISRHKKREALFINAAKSQPAGTKESAVLELEAIAAGISAEESENELSAVMRKIDSLRAQTQALETQHEAQKVLRDISLN